MARVSGRDSDDAIEQSGASGDAAQTHFVATGDGCAGIGTNGGAIGCGGQRVLQAVGVTWTDSGGHTSDPVSWTFAQEPN